MRKKVETSFARLVAADFTAIMLYDLVKSLKLTPGDIMLGTLPEFESYEEVSEIYRKLLDLKQKKLEAELKKVMGEKKNDS